MLAALGARRPVGCRVALVVAHQDDETIAAGGSLHLLPELLLVHVTDGAPRELDDAARQGFASPEAYGAARERELQAALKVAGATPTRIALGVPDQGAADAMAFIAEALEQAFLAHGIQTVMTHAYEGGHPDHDSTAFAVHRAAGRARLPVFEFAGYHAGPGGAMIAQRFLPGPAETRIVLDAAEAAQKRAMLDCFVTQRGILGAFEAGVERFRRGPHYDFTAPPHAGPLNYENWGWALTGAAWRARAGAILPQELQCAS